MKFFFNKKINKVLVAIFILVGLLFPMNFASADALSDLQNQLNALKNQKTKNAAAITQKEQEIVQLQNQIKYVENQIGSTQNAIVSTTEQIANTEKNIVDLSGQIDTAQAKLDAQLKDMSKIIVSWYTEGQTGLVSAVLSSDNMSDAITKQEYYDSVRRQIKMEMERISAMKADLGAQKDDKSKQLAQLSDLKGSQVEQQSYLENRKNIKNELLTNSKSTITNLQDEQAKADAAIADLQSRIRKIQSASIGTGGDVVSGSPTGWYLKQGYNGDQPWSGYKMGYYATIGSYGCLLTSLTMIANFYGASYTPATAADRSSFVHTWGGSDGSLISTSIVNDGGSKSIDWNAVDNELANNRPVIVGVALGVNMGNSYGVSHFVVLTDKVNGKYLMQDPIGTGRGYSKSQVKAYRVVRP
jgi:peptidoglycan hydrolase CwlO-like protein